MGPSGPATSLRGNMCWVHDCVAGGEGSGEEDSGRWGSGVKEESGEVSRPVGDWMKGKERVGRVAGREGVELRSAVS